MSNHEPPALPGLRGARVLVTGGSRGIGRATAVLFAGCGAHVGIAYRQAAAAAEETLRRLGEAAEGAAWKPWAAAADVSTQRGVEELFRRVDEEFGGRLDVLVGNAGIWNQESRPLESIEPSEWRRMIDVNLTSVYLTTREAIRRMGPGSRIVLVSSTAAQRGEAGHGHYAATKGAIQSLVKSLAAELGVRGITVNAVAPGWVDTDMAAEALRGAGRSRIEREIPLGRVAAPEDVAGPIVFLCSDWARHVTGEVLNVNGGSVLCG